jgi:NAD(P)-dependent dehydrogenase (short-subunit alcohol dehydrogenase family)
LLIDPGMSALVTGGYQGVGRFLADALAQRGARVTVCDIQPEVGGLRDELGEHVNGVRADVTSLPDLREVVETAADHGHGRLDLVVSNVAVSAVTNPWDDVEKSLEVFDQLVAANLRASLALGRLVVPKMIEQQAGHIIHVGTDHIHNCQWPVPVSHSDADASGCTWLTRSWKVGIPDLDIYDMTKWGLNAFATDWALALRKENIRVNNYNMGMVDTAPLREYFASAGIEPPVTPLSRGAVESVFVALVEEEPGRSGDIVGLWCGHPAVLPPPQPHAFSLTGRPA